jgi:hypothetical protein
MSDYLKGNYQLSAKKGAHKSAPKKAKATTSSREEFERRAREKLGGSIAFISLSDDFVWRGSESD